MPKKTIFETIENATEQLRAERQDIEGAITNTESRIAQLEKQSREAEQRIEELENEIANPALSLEKCLELQTAVEALRHRMVAAEKLADDSKHVLPKLEMKRAGIVNQIGSSIRASLVTEREKYQGEIAGHYREARSVAAKYLRFLNEVEERFDLVGQNVNLGRGCSVHGKLSENDSQ